MQRKGNILYGTVFVVGAMMLLYTTVPVSGEFFPEQVTATFSADYPMGLWNSTEATSQNVITNSTALYLDDITESGSYKSKAFTYSGASTLYFNTLEYDFNRHAPFNNITVQSSNTSGFSYVNGAETVELRNGTNTYNLTGNITAEKYGRVLIDYVAATLTGKWDLDSMVYDTRYEIGYPVYRDTFDAAFSDDGKNMVIARTESPYIVTFNLSTPFDASTKTEYSSSNLGWAGFEHVDISANGQHILAIDNYYYAGHPATYVDNGNYLYEAGNLRDLNVYQLSDPYNISTRSLYSSDYLGGNDARVDDIIASDDGTHIITLNTYFDEFHQYNLSDPHNVSTFTKSATYDYAATSNFDNNPEGITDNGAGSAVYGIERGDPGYIYEFDIELQADNTPKLNSLTVSGSTDTTTKNTDTPRNSYIQMAAVALFALIIVGAALNILTDRH